MAFSLILTGCASKETTTTSATSQTEATTSASDNSAILEGAVEIALSDGGIKVDGNAIETEETSAVYGANDIVYYMSGQDFKYGEGTEKDAHSKDEAEAHTVVHITQPGRYALRRLPTPYIAYLFQIPLSPDNDFYIAPVHTLRSCTGRKVRLL